MKRNTEIKQQLAQPEYKGCTYSINVHIKKENEVKHTSKDFPHKATTLKVVHERGWRSQMTSQFTSVLIIWMGRPHKYFKPAHTSTQFTVWWIKNMKSQKILVVSSEFHTLLPFQNSNENIEKYIKDSMIPSIWIKCHVVWKDFKSINGRFCN